MNVQRAGCLGVWMLIMLGGLGSAIAEETERNPKHLGMAIPTAEEIVNSLQLPCAQLPGCSRQIRMGGDHPKLTKPVEASISTSLVNFETGSFKLNRTSRRVLDAFAKALRDPRTTGTIVVEGHADKRGTDRINDPLSQARAEAAVRYLVANGVDASRLKAEGRGSRAPMNLLDPVDRLNRRIEFVVSYPAGTEVKQ